MDDALKIANMGDMVNFRLLGNRCRHVKTIMCGLILLSYALVVVVPIDLRQRANVDIKAERP